MDITETFEQLMGLVCLGKEKLCGGVTNENYAIDTCEGRFVIRIPGKGTNEYINRRWEIGNMRKVNFLGFIPKIFHADETSGIIISKYITNSTPMMKGDLNDPHRLEMICDRLALLHRTNIKLVNEFDLQKNKKHYLLVLRRMGVSLPKELKVHVKHLEESTIELFQKFPKESVPCHGDPKFNNFLLEDNFLWLIDWEYSGMADRYFDLVNLTMTDDLNEEEEHLVLQQYEKSASIELNWEKYIRYKIATDYHYIYWHLIKLFQGEMVEYNEMSWKKRLYRALDNMKILGGL